MPDPHKVHSRTKRNATPPIKGGVALRMVSKG